MWIREWVLFHYLIGVRYFYIGIHNTQDRSVEVLKQLSKYINIKIFVVSDTSHFPPQQNFYQFTIDRFQHEVDWMAMIDGDEFLFSTKFDTLQEALQNLSDQKLSCIGVYWKCFGSSGHIKEPSGLILENFKYRALDDFKANRHIKSVIQTKFARGTIILGVHHFETTFGTFDELGRLVTAGLSEHNPSWDHLRINHYLCQSREYFLKVKRPQGAADINVKSKQNLRSEDWWEGHDRNEIKCDAIDYFIPGLKRLDDSLSRDMFEDARSQDFRMPAKRWLCFMTEMLKNFYIQPRLSLTRALGIGVKIISRY